MSVYYFYKGDDVPFRYLRATRMVGCIPPPYETAMTASAYLEFAIEDLEEGSDRGLVNSFGNAKRALHLAIDGLLHQYGLFCHFRRHNFPSKLQILDDLRILPVTLVRNLNIERNAIEHEYSTPSRGRVEEAVDVARLLILATEQLLKATPHEVVVGWRNPSRHALIQVHPQEGQLRVFTVTAPTHYRKIHGVSCLSGHVRTFDGSKYTKGIKVSKKPWKIIELDRASKAAWAPIVAELVKIQRTEGSRRGFIDREAGEMTMTVTVPLVLPEGVTWQEVLDKALGEKFER